MIIRMEFDSKDPMQTGPKRIYYFRLITGLADGNKSPLVILYYDNI
jgi:hypothetical protein